MVDQGLWGMKGQIVLRKGWYSCQIFIDPETQLRRLLDAGTVILIKGIDGVDLYGAGLMKGMDGVVAFVTPLQTTGDGGGGGGGLYLQCLPATRRAAVK